MTKLKKWLQKIITFSVIAITATFCLLIPLSKADDGVILAQIYQKAASIDTTSTNIANILNNILTQVTTILERITASGTQWLAADTSTPTSELQSKFTDLNNAYMSTLKASIDAQKPLLTEFFSQQSLPYLNDLTYGSLWGNLYNSPDPRGTSVDPALNYVKNASGLSISHIMPGKAPVWQGSPRSIANYESYYKTIASVQTFNVYVMSQAYANKQNGFKFTNAQLALIKQASDAKDWFAVVASENIGIVLRQILMYDSQIYLTLTQLLQTQQQSVMAQAMTNTLLILGNQFTESDLLGKATGARAE